MKHLIVVLILIIQSLMLPAFPPTDQGILGAQPYEGRERCDGTDYADYTLPSQISQLQEIAAGRTIDHITMSIGGNDIDFSAIITALVLRENGLTAGFLDSDLDELMGGFVKNGQWPFYAALRDMTSIPITGWKGNFKVVPGMDQLTDLYVGLERQLQPFITPNPSRLELIFTVLQPGEPVQTKKKIAWKPRAYVFSDLRIIFSLFIPLAPPSLSLKSITARGTSNATSHFEPKSPPCAVDMCGVRRGLGDDDSTKSRRCVSPTWKPETNSRNAKMLYELRPFDHVLIDPVEQVMLLKKGEKEISLPLQYGQDKKLHNGSQLLVNQVSQGSKVKEFKTAVAKTQKGQLSKQAKQVQQKPKAKLPSKAPPPTQKQKIPAQKKQLDVRKSTAPRPGIQRIKQKN